MELVVIGFIIWGAFALVLLKSSENRLKELKRDKVKLTAAKVEATLTLTDIAEKSSDVFAVANAKRSLLQIEKIDAR